ncbi:hypothetical protein D9M70_643110 [compost metagenome]
MARLRAQYVDGTVHAIDGPAYLHARIHQWFAAFTGDLQRQRLVSAAHQFGKVAQYFGSTIRGKPPLAILESRMGKLEFGFQRGSIVFRKLIDKLSVECLDDFDHFTHSRYFSPTPLMS